jgi:asparagine synthase (glutamine-hydrolysing)
MCGIFGCLFPRDPERVDVDAALAALHRRGPDHASSHRGKDAILGFARLSILDLTPAGHQPMVSTDGMTILVFNGEIYNHHEIREELRARGHQFRGRSDSEVILEGYRAFGDSIVDRLDGMFAFCIFDGTKRRALLGRDRAGKKPLFYTFDGQELRFASEPKALEASGIALRPKLSALAGLLALGYVPGPETFHEGVLEVPPAHILVLDAGAVPRVTRYWDLPAVDPTLEALDAPTAAAELRRLVTAAVERRLEADVPLGAFLSGGVDSTVIVGLLAKAKGPGVKTFSIGFAGDARYDETAFARDVAARFGANHTEFRIEPSSLDLVDDLVAAHDGPFGDSSAIPTSVVSRLTREHVTVALSGDGGDELFYGYQRFFAAEATEHVPMLVRDGLSLVARRVPMGASERTLQGKAIRFLTRAALPLGERLVGYMPYFAGRTNDVLRPEFQDSGSSVHRFVSRIDDASDFAAHRILANNYRSYLPGDLLVKTDRSSMHHSLEVRAPLLDKALTEYAFRLPARFHRRGTTGKWLFKKAFEDLLPSNIARRPKMGFGVPLGTWFRGPLKGALDDLFGPSAEVRRLLQPGVIDRLRTEHDAETMDHGQRLFLLLTLELWLRRKR